jgi:hypothetical protein
VPLKSKKEDISANDIHTSFPVLALVFCALGTQPLNVILMSSRLQIAN